MGNNSTKLSKKKLKTNKRKKKFSCCRCTSNGLSNSYSSSLCSIDERYYPTFDRIFLNNNQYLSSIDNIIFSVSKKNVTDYCQSIKDLEQCRHGAINIDQWINSLPINQSRTNQTNSIEKHKSIDDNQELLQILELKSNSEFLNLVKKFQLDLYLNDYHNRLTKSNKNQTFKTHFSSSAIICPFNGHQQCSIDDFNLFVISSPETILPNLSTNTSDSRKIHEQQRSKCYFVPMICFKIEPNDDEYKQKSLEIDQTHVSNTVESNQKTDQTPVKYEPACIFLSNDSFQTGFIHVKQDKISKEYLPFISYNSQDNISYLSSNLIQQWFNTLILVNQTCAVVHRFLAGNANHMTCLLNEQFINQSNKENSFSYSNNIIFASLRRPLCTYLSDISSTDNQEKNSEKFTEAVSSLFLSDNTKISNELIHIDYEEYSFGFVLQRWPRILIENYYTHPDRYSKRQWPSKYHMNIVIKTSLLLIPNSQNDKWNVNFDFIDEYLFKLMNKTTLFFYILCQQLFSQTYSIRIIIKHCFLNYCEKYGLPFSNINQRNIMDLVNHFLKELSENINNNFFPNYFNHQVNLLNSNEDYNPWFEYMNKFIKKYIDISSLSPSSSLMKKSNRSVATEFLFYFTNQLYQTLQMQPSKFHVNDTILLDLHKQFFEKLSNDNHSLLSKELMNDLLNNSQILETIKMKLTRDFEKNAELVHVCLNQIRKAQTSLMFHYIWTIFIQYLHSYYNILWNI